MRRRQISGPIHMFVLHFSLASVTESVSWSFSLGLKDFFPPAPVRCPNSPWLLKLMTSQVQRGCCYGWLCFCNLVVTWCLTKFPQLYTEFKGLIQMSLSKSGENIIVNLQPLSKERSGPAFKLCKETGTISTHKIKFHPQLTIKHQLKKAIVLKWRSPSLNKNEEPDLGWFAVLSWEHVTMG